MQENYFIKYILNNFRYPPTDSQYDVILSFVNFLTTHNGNSIFCLKGYAGTGKTTLVSAFVNTLKEINITTVLLAPTGRAAKVFSTYSKEKAFTIHKYIYRQKDLVNEDPSYDLSFNKKSNTIFFVDEASMISNTYVESTFGSGCLLDDLMEFVFNGKNNKLVLIGDTAQLPPVGLNISPALDKNVLLSYFNTNVAENFLNNVVRQASDSGVLYNANLVRSILLGELHSLQLESKLFAEVHNIVGTELLEELDTCYSRYGENETLVISRSNSRANRYNNGIRQRILYKEEDFCSGDRIMIVKNNYFWCKDYDNIDFIANGDIATVRRARRRETLYGSNFIEADLEFDDYEQEINCMLLLDTLQMDSPALSRDQSYALFKSVEEDYMDIKSKRKRYEKIREDKYFNALQIKFSYAITCHKAQGGQWDAVFIDQGYLPDENINEDYYRWLYTAITRAKKELYFVNFDKRFINTENI